MDKAIMSSLQGLNVRCEVFSAMEISIMASLSLVDRSKRPVVTSVCRASSMKLEAGGWSETSAPIYVV